MKWTSRLSRSSFETTIGHFSLQTTLRAAASCGRRSSASAPFASLDFDESIYDVAALGSGKPGEGSTLNQIPDTKGYATGCRFRCRNLIKIKCADCRICSALWVELLQRYFSRILTGDRAFLAGVMCRDESRYRSV